MDPLSKVKRVQSGETTSSEAINQVLTYENGLGLSQRFSFSPSPFFSFSHKLKGVIKDVHHHFALIFGLLGVTLLGSPRISFSAPPPIKDFKIVIDPGHGGADFGAIHKENGKIVFSEKDGTLNISRELKRQLQNKGYPVILTRDQDAVIVHNARTAIANREKAKLFISIHMNSLPPDHKGPIAEGVETYILNNTTDQSSKRLAELENKGLDPTKGSDLTSQTEVNLILKDLVIDANLSESKRLACALQNHMISVTGQKNRGVKQAMFMVLLGADMPSALIEAGFVTSQKDRKLIGSEHGLRAIAASMVRAIEQFRLQKNTPAARQALSKCQVREHPPTEH